ncbi:MAG: polysaccharide deacetylase family protein [Erysipelotrichaceae bacterium]|nr:polysaccharide deacetylase family protein [Erysipelotrichaceae bacterium]
MEHIYICFPYGKFKAITFSYDDGKITDRRLVELFNKYHLKATFHLNSGLLGQKEDHTYSYIEKDEVTTLYKNHEVASHSSTHPTLTRIPYSMAIENILEDRKSLEKMTNTLVQGFSYPNGVYDETIKSVLKSIGIVYARTTKSTHGYDLPDDYLEWHPTCHHNDEKLEELSNYFIRTKYDQRLNLLYIWGHSYEFERDHSWDGFEKLLASISNKEEIWYATNIDIYKYMNAAKQLIFFANHSKVYNPTQENIWLSNNNKIIQVKKGETQCLI